MATRMHNREFDGAESGIFALNRLKTLHDTMEDLTRQYLKNHKDGKEIPRAALQHMSKALENAKELVARVEKSVTGTVTGSKMSGTKRKLKSEFVSDVLFTG